MSSKSIVVTLELGHKAAVRPERTTDGFTHNWEVFVQGLNGSSIESFIQKIVFYLHESFDIPKRVVKSPPFRIQEKGYGAFNLPIEIYFKSSDPHTRKTKFEYDLFLQSLDSDPIEHIRKEKLTFNKPAEDFRKRLLQGGGVEVSNLEDGRLNGKSSVSKPSSGAKTKPSVRHHTNTPTPTSTSDSNQRKQKIELKKEPGKSKVKDQFRDLFGETIDIKRSSEQKILLKDKSSKSKEKAQKEKEHDKHANKSDSKKVHEREKSKEKHSKKDKEKGHKKITKDKDREHEKDKDASGKKGSDKERAKHFKDSKEIERDKASKHDSFKRSASPASSIASDSSAKKKKGEKEQKKNIPEVIRVEKPIPEALSINQKEKTAKSIRSPKEKTKIKENVPKSLNHKNLPMSTLQVPPTAASPKQKDKGKVSAKAEKSPNWNAKEYKQRSEAKSIPKVPSHKDKSKPKSHISPAPRPPLSRSRSRSSSISGTSSSRSRSRSRSRSSSQSSASSSQESRSRSPSQSTSRSRSRSRSSSISNKSRSKSSSAERSKSASRSLSRSRSRSRSSSSNQPRCKSKTSHRSRSSSFSSCGSSESRTPSAAPERNIEKVSNSSGSINPLGVMINEVSTSDSDENDSHNHSPEHSPISELPPPPLPPLKEAQKTAKLATESKTNISPSHAKSKASGAPASGSGKKYLTPPVLQIGPPTHRSPLSSSSDENDRTRFLRPSRDRRKKRKGSIEDNFERSPKSEPINIRESKVNGMASPAKTKTTDPSLSSKIKVKDSESLREEGNLLPSHNAVKTEVKNEFSKDYLEELYLLRNKIESSFSDRSKVQEIVDIISEYAFNADDCLNFELCELDLETIRRLQQCFVVK